MFNVGQRVRNYNRRSCSGRWLCLGFVMSFFSSYFNSILFYKIIIIQHNNMFFQPHHPTVLRSWIIDVMQGRVVSPSLTHWPAGSEYSDQLRLGSYFYLPNRYIIYMNGPYSDLLAIRDMIWKMRNEVMQM